MNWGQSPCTPTRREKRILPANLVGFSAHVSPGSCLHGSGGPCKELAPARDTWILLQHGSPLAAGAQLPRHGLHHRMQGKFSSSTWSTSFPLFCIDLGVNRAVPLTCYHSTLLWPQLHLCNNIFSFLNMLSPGITTIPDGFGFGQQWVPWSLQGLALLDMGEASGQFSQKPAL